MRMGKWEWGDVKAESSGSWIYGSNAPVLEELDACECQISSVFVLQIIK